MTFEQEVCMFDDGTYIPRVGRCPKGSRKTFLASSQCSTPRSQCSTPRSRCSTPRTPCSPMSPFTDDQRTMLRYLLEKEKMEEGREMEKEECPTCCGVPERVRLSALRPRSETSREVDEIIRRTTEGMRRERKNDRCDENIMEKRYTLDDGSVIKQTKTVKTCR